jgi:hypothetical protein
MVLYRCVLIVFSLHQESVNEPLPEVVLSQLVSEEAVSNTLVPKNHSYTFSMRIA